MTRQMLVLVAAFGCFGPIVAGCGGSGVKLYPVTGTVKFNGQPVEGAVVSFRCEELKKIATGTTDAEGRFKLTTYQEGEGAVAGKHAVTVTKVSTPRADHGELSMDDAVKQTRAPAETRTLLPAKYADPERPLIFLTVSASEKNDFTIELVE